MNCVLVYNCGFMALFSFTLTTTCWLYLIRYVSCDNHSVYCCWLWRVIVVCNIKGFNLYGKCGSLFLYLANKCAWRKWNYLVLIIYYYLSLGSFLPFWMNMLISKSNFKLMFSRLLFNMSSLGLYHASKYYELIGWNNFSKI